MTTTLSKLVMAFFLSILIPAFAQADTAVKPLPTIVSEQLLENIHKPEASINVIPSDANDTSSVMLQINTDGTFSVNVEDPQDMSTISPQNCVKFAGYSV